MSIIQETAIRVLQRHLPVVYAKTDSTSLQAIAKSLRPREFNQTCAMLEDALRSEFQHDPFSADMAALCLYMGLDKDVADVFSASFGGDDETQLAVQKAYVSKENLVTVHQQQNFILDIQPLHEEMRSFQNRIHELKQKAGNGHMVPVMPTAKISCWIDALKHVVEKFPKTKKKFKSEFSQLDDSGLFTTNESSHQRVRSALASVEEALAKLDVASVYSMAGQIYSANAGVEERANMARAGVVETPVLWVEVVNWLSQLDPCFEMLTSHRVLSQMAAADVATLDFSPFRADEAPRPLAGSTMYVADRVNGGVIQKSGMESAHVGAPRAIKSAHLTALVFNIISTAGGICEYKAEDNYKSGATVLQCQSLVPLNWHVLAPVFNQRLRDTWKTFLPEIKPLEFFRKLVDLANSKKTPVRSISTEEPALRTALLGDLKGIVTAVHDAAYNGVSISVKDAMAGARNKLVGYRHRAVCIDPDVLVTITSDAKAFAQLSTVKAAATRQVGVVEYPVSNGVGFAEALLAARSGEFARIFHSALTSDVAKLYNNVMDLDAVGGNELHFNVTIAHMLENAVSDVRRGLRRDNTGGKMDVSVRDLVQGVKYTPHTGTYFVQSVASDKRRIMIARGVDHIMHEWTVLGNIHSSFGFGRMVGGRDHISTTHQRAMAEAVVAVAEEFLDNYGVAAVKLENDPHVDINLDEENKEYSRRLNLRSRVFGEFEMPNALELLTITNSTLASDHFRDLFKPELICGIDQWQFEVRHDMMALIKTLSDSALDQLTRMATDEVLTLLYTGMMDELSLEQRQLIIQQAYRSPLKMVTNRLAEMVQGVDTYIALVFMLNVIQGLGKLYSSDESSEDSETGEE
jgi:hypothetical protein